MPLPAPYLEKPIKNVSILFRLYIFIKDICIRNIYLIDLEKSIDNHYNIVKIWYGDEIYASESLYTWCR